jgi:hypothetical protein
VSKCQLWYKMELVVIAGIMMQDLCQVACLPIVTLRLENVQLDSNLSSQTAVLAFYSFNSFEQNFCHSTPTLVCDDQQWCLVHQKTEK